MAFGNPYTQAMLTFKKYCFDNGYREKVYGDDAYQKTRDTQSPMCKILGAKGGKIQVFETGKGRFELDTDWEIQNVPEEGYMPLAQDLLKVCEQEEGEINWEEIGNKLEEFGLSGDPQNWVENASTVLSVIISYTEEHEPQATQDIAAMKNARSTLDSIVL